MKKFKLELNDLLKANARPTNVTIKNEKLYDLWIRNHKNIFQAMGGKSLAKTITLKDEYIKPEPPNSDYDESYAYEKFVNLFGDTVFSDFLYFYYEKYNFSEENLMYPMIGKIKTTKHLSYYLDKIYTKERSLDKDEYEHIKRYISHLGEAYSENTTKQGKFECEMTSELHAFLRLGDYENWDNDSCFNVGGGSEKDKYKIAISKNTFVFWVKDKGRAWGFSNDSMTGFYLTNFYCESVPLFKFLFKRFIEDHFKQSYQQIDPNKCKITSAPYLNRDKICFCTKGNVVINQEFVNPNQMVSLDY